MTSIEFKAIREDLGLTQAELADWLGMAQPHISRIERGERQPTRQQAAAIRLLRITFSKNGAILPVTKGREH